jgi:hypothetical protein
VVMLHYSLNMFSTPALARGAWASRRGIVDCLYSMTDTIPKNALDR